MDPTLLQKDEPVSPERALGSVEETESSNGYRELKADRARPPSWIKLEPPVEFDGKKYHELVLDFDQMNGKDFARVHRTYRHTFRKELDETQMPEMTVEFQVLMVAQVADVPQGLIWKLPRAQFIAVRNEALKACGSSLEETAD